MIKLTETGVNLIERLSHLSNLSELVLTAGDSINEKGLYIYFSAPCQSELTQETWHNLIDSEAHRILNLVNKEKTRLKSLFETQQVEQGNSCSSPSICVSQNSPVWKCQILSESCTTPTDETCWCLKKLPSTRESLLYYYALLNSKPVSFWIKQVSSSVDGIRTFTKKDIENIPLRTIKWDETRDNPVREEKIASIKNAINSNDYQFIEASLALELQCGREEIVHDAICTIVENLFELNKKIEKYTPLFGLENLETIGQNLPIPLNAPLSKIVPTERRADLGQHPEIFQDIPENVDLSEFCLAKFRREEGLKFEGDHIALLSHDNTLIKLYGPPSFMDIIDEKLAGQIGNYYNEIVLSIALPTSAEEFQQLKEEIHQRVKSLLDKRKGLWTLLDQIFHLLYGLETKKTTQSPTS